MNCPYCGRVIEDDATFCEFCGKAVTPQERLCVNCGTPLSAQAQFCSKCGTPVQPTAAPAQTAPPAYPSAPPQDYSVFVKQTDATATYTNKRKISPLIYIAGGILLVAIIVFVTLTLITNAAANNVAGEWKLQTVEAAGFSANVDSIMGMLDSFGGLIGGEMDLSQLDMLKGGLLLNLEKDGNGAMKSGSSVYPLTYTKLDSGKIEIYVTIDNLSGMQALSAEMKDGTLVVTTQSMFGVKLVFKRV